MTFNIEIVLRGCNEAVTEPAQYDTAPRSWDTADVEAVLKEMLLAIDRTRNPRAESRHVALRGFSWIVEPSQGGVVIALEIPTGVAVAGPFDIPQARLDRLITTVLAPQAAVPNTTVH